MKAAARLLRLISAQKATKWDALHEYWLAAILSAPTTHMVNMTSNFAHIGWHYTAERLTEALINTVVGRAEGARLGEFKYILGGILPGLARGARNFLRSWDMELPSLEASLGREGGSKLDEITTSIGGLKGRIIRWDLRLLVAADELAKGLIVEMEVGVQAYRMAKAEGLSGDQLRQRIATLTQDTASPAWDAAIGLARKLTFQEPMGNVGQATISLRNKWGPFGYIVPFVTTPVNIFKTGLAKSPLGTITLAARIYHGAKTGDWRGITPQIAQQVIAWGLVLALMGNDDDDPWMTGAARHEQPRGARDLARRTFPPQSIKIGDQWFSYGRIEPFATVLSTTVDWIQALKSGSPATMVKTPFRSLMGQLSSKTFLSGLSDFLDALTSGKPEDAARWASNFAVSWVPNLARSTLRATRETYPERRVWGRGMEWVERFGRRTLQRTELGILPELPAYDLWGRPAKKPGSPLPRTDILWRILSPVEVRTPDIFVGDRVILGWNNAHPDAEYRPELPQPTYKGLGLGGQQRAMTDEQYAQYLKESGQLAAQYVSNFQWNLLTPTAGDVARVKRLIVLARERTKTRLVREWARR